MIEGGASKARPGIFPGRVHFVIERVLHHRESRGLVDHEAIHLVFSDEFIRY